MIWQLLTRSPLIPFRPLPCLPWPARIPCPPPAPSRMTAFSPTCLSAGRRPHAIPGPLSREFMEKDAKLANVLSFVQVLHRTGQFFALSCLNSSRSGSCLPDVTLSRSSSAARAELPQRQTVSASQSASSGPGPVPPRWRIPEAMPPLK